MEKMCEAGHEVEDLGTRSAESVDYPMTAQRSAGPSCLAQLGGSAWALADEQVARPWWFVSSSDWLRYEADLLDFQMRTATSPRAG